MLVAPNQEIFFGHDISLQQFVAVEDCKTIIFNFLFWRNCQWASGPVVKRPTLGCMILGSSHVQAYCPHGSIQAEKYRAASVLKTDQPDQGRRITII